MEGGTIHPLTGLPMPATIGPRVRGVNRFTGPQRKLLDAQVAAMLFRRMPILTIARELDVADQTVRQAIKRLEAEWIKAANINFDAAKGRELQEIDHLQRRYELAYEESKKNRKRQAVRANFTGPDGERRSRPESQIIEQEDRPEGDPRFLDGILRCIDRRIKLLGLDEPEKFDINHGVGHGNGRTAVADRKAKALELFGVVVYSDTGAEAEGSLALGDGSGESVDSGDSYIETSGILSSS